jgi:dTDP-4-dehydrorhamnose 3,5-epimerase
MKTLTTSLPGVVLLQLDAFGDHRGGFMETYRRERYAEVGIAADLVQDNFSWSARSVLRGLHYQLRQPQGKLVHVLRGEVFDVVVDIRRGSPNFGQWFGVTLSGDNRLQMWIPPGFAHGFLVRSERVDYLYKVTAPYTPADERVIRWDDPELGIAWPLDGEPVLSVRDQRGALLRDAELPAYLP